MPPVIPPKPIVAQQAKPAGNAPIVKSTQQAPLGKQAVSTAKPVTVDKMTLVQIEQTGPVGNEVYKVKSARGTLLYSSKRKGDIETWVKAAALEKLQS